jgi:hypothetical protein
VSGLGGPSGGSGGIDPSVRALGPFWSAGRVTQMLAFGSDAEVLDAVGSRILMGLRTVDGAAIFPVRQFESVGAEVRVRPFVVMLLDELRGHDPWAVALVTFLYPVPELGHRTFGQAVDDGIGLDAIREAGASIGRDWRAGGGD